MLQQTGKHPHHHTSIFTSHRNGPSMNFGCLKLRKNSQQHLSSENASGKVSPGHSGPLTTTPVVQGSIHHKTGTHMYPHPVEEKKTCGSKNHRKRVEKSKQPSRPRSPRRRDSLVVSCKQAADPVTVWVVVPVIGTSSVLNFVRLIF